MSVRLSLVIPCYNEQSRFEQGFNHYISYFKRQKYPWEIILVNDGSRDKTLNLIKSQIKKYKNVSAISYANNHGKGYALIRGVGKAVGKYILFSDIDHAVDISTIESFYKLFEKGFQVIIGSRRVKGAKLIKRQHAVREFLGRGFTLLVRILIDRKIYDATCGFKAFEKKVAQKLFSKVTIFDWAFDAELIFLSKKYNLKLAQAPVAWSDVTGSKVSIGKDVAMSLWGLIKIRINDLQGKYA